MRYERLIIEAGDNTFALDFHPRLTIVGGVGRLERDGLVNELVGALGSTRSGVHLELEADNQKRFAIFRPHGATHRVVDVENAVEVTSQFSDSEGRVDLLDRAGLDARTAKAVMRFGASDLISTSDRDKLIRRLSQTNQNELWVAAEALRSAQRRLDEEAEAVGSNAEDAEVIEHIEERHAEHEARQALFEKVRGTTFLLGGFLALAIVPAMLSLGILAAGVLGVIAMLTVLSSAATWRIAERARIAEEHALANAGAQSYLGFHLQRVNGLLSSDQARRRLMQAAEEHREALRRWGVVAGDVEVDWVLKNREHIDNAVQLRNDVIGKGGFSAENAEDAERASSMAQSLIARLEELRTLGHGAERFPAILDEPYSAVDSTVKPSMLELLVRASEHQQIILLTDDPEVRDWARVEAMTGALTLVEPSEDSDEIAADLRIEAGTA